MAVMDREALTVWPKQQEAAGILGVDPSRLTRWLEERKSDVEWTQGAKLVRPTAVLQFAEQYRLQVVRVAARLLTHVSEATDNDRLEREISDELNAYLAGYERRRTPRSVETHASFLNDLEHLLPPHLYKEVLARLPGRSKLHSIIGATEGVGDGE